MSHGHAHSHARVIAPEGDRRRLLAALAVLLAVMALEIVAGIVGHSLALLSDAGHMLTDAGAIAFSVLAIQLAARPARGAMTFGFSRVEILSAQANGVTLLILAGFITYAAVRRLISPPQVHGWLMLAVALVGIAANVLIVWLLAGAERRSLNVEGSLQHVLTDLYAFIGTAIAAVVILLTGFNRADPIASLLIAVLMIRAGVSLISASGRVFLEAAPADLTRRRSARRSWRSRASPRSTTCMCGKSQAASRRCRRTCWWALTATATRRAGGWSRCCTSASAWSTRPCRWTTNMRRCWRSSPA